MLNQVQEKMREIILSLNDDESLKYFETLSSGKKLRSKLILNIAGQSDESVKLSAIVELIHLASLLHDDVIDDALTRRGDESFNAKFGDKSAIMLGDILYSKAFYELSSMDEMVAKTVSNAVSELSIGELADVSMSSKFNLDEQKYLDMLYKKTAVLIEASAVSSAYLAGKDTQKFSTYGKNLGLAFQIIDDILDITQDSQTLGKPALHDFKEGKTTLPYMYAYNALDAQGKNRLKGMFRKNLAKDDIIWIKQKMGETGAVKKAFAYAKSLGNEALKAIEDENLPKLNEVVSSMIDREF